MQAALIFTIKATLLFAVAALQPTTADAKQAAPPPALLDGLPDAERAAAAKSIGIALQSLQKAQTEGGGFTRMDTDAAEGNGTGITSLAGMALLAHGGGREDSPYHAPMVRCVDYVLDCQDKDSGVFKAARGGKQGSLYNHSTATAFLAKALGSVGDARQDRVRDSLKRAIELLAKAQAVPKAEVSQGGWRYMPNSKDSDLSCTAWALRALYAAKEAGLEIPDGVIEKAVGYVKRTQHEGGGFRYTADAPNATASLTAMGLFCLQKAGEAETEAAAKAAAFLVAESKKGTKAFEFYGAMWGSAAMSLRGGDDAKRYANWMVKHCATRQREDGRWNGGSGDILGTISVILAHGAQH